MKVAADRPIALYTKTWMSGGTGLFAQELAAGMLDAGASVIFVAPPAQDVKFEVARSGLSRFRSRRENMHGSRPSRVMASIARVASSAIGLARARLRTRHFIISIPDPLIFAIPFLFVLRLLGAQIIYVVHDPLPHAWKLPVAFRWLEHGSFSLTYKLSQTLVVLSHSAREALLSAYKISGKRVAVIEHGIFVLGMPTPASGNGILLLFGTLRRNKGILEAIKATVEARAQGASVRLVIAGSPDPVELTYWTACETLAREHPEAITLELGYVDDIRLQQLINMSDAFLLPYREFHSQSGVAVLASSNARAAVASRAGGIGDLIAEGMAAVPIEEPAGVSAITDAICTFARVPIADWNSRATEFRASMIKRRNWPSIAADYLALIQSTEPA